MKRLLSIILIICIVFSLSSGFAADPVAVEKITLDKTAATVAVKQAIGLKATISPKNATNKKIVWSSSDESIATVSNGKVVGVSEGTATITAATEDEKGASATAEITVIIPVKKITLSETKQFPLALWVPWRIAATIEPFNATVFDLEWTSSDESIAKVGQDGVVIGQAPGTARITASAKDGSKVKASVSVKVKKYDLVFQTKSTQSVKYYYGSGIFNIKGSVKTGCVKIPTLNEGMLVAIGTRTEEKSLAVTPVKPGEDVVTINVTGQRRFVYNVFVSPEMYTDSSASIQNAESQEAGEILCLDIPWGSTYNEAKEILKNQNKTIKPPGKRNDYIRALIHEDIFFADCIAYTAALNFTYSGETEKEITANSSFFKGDLYFDLDYSLDQLQLAVRRVYGLDQGKKAGESITWTKDDVVLKLTRKEKFNMLEFEKK